MLTIFLLRENACMACGCETEGINAEHSRILWAVLLINAVMFFIEGVSGWLVESTGLIGDALDMLADAMVYGVAIYALQHSLKEKIRAARLSAWMQVFLGCLILSDVIRRFVFGSEPHSLTMVVISLLALAANVACLVMLARIRHGGVHIRATWIFTRNDVMINLAVMLSGLFVALTGSAIPDLVTGLVIVLIVMHGARLILEDAKRESQSLSSNGGCCSINT